MTALPPCAAAWMALGLFAAANLATLAGTVSRSYDGSRSATMLHRLRGLEKLGPERLVLLDAPDAFGALLAARHARGHVTVLLSGAVPSPAAGLCDASGRRTAAFRISPGFERVACEWRASYHDLAFDLTSGTEGTHRFLRFVLPGGVSSADAVLVSPAADGSVVNNSWPRSPSGYYEVDRLAHVRDHLAAVDSSLGHTIIPGVTEDVALWPYEPDFADAAAGIQGVGRHLLFEALNPEPGSRLLLDFTAGSLSAQTAGLPPAKAIGEDASGFGFVGRGAARMLSGAITPRIIDGHPYLAVDLGMAPLRFETARHGLAGLYNRQLSLDPRHLVGFVRNISLVTDEMIAAMSPPSKLKNFPRDLLEPGLLFSGLYEDGWMAEVAWIRLDARGGSRQLRVRGRVPGLLPAGAALEVRADDRMLVTQSIGPGDFDLRVELLAEGPHWIELRADRTARLPAPDGRVASVLLTSIGFAPPE